MIYRLQWYKSSKNGLLFPNYYAIALGDMEDDGCEIISSIEIKEIIFAPARIGWDIEDEIKVSKYEEQIKLHTGREDLRVIRWKRRKNGSEPLKIVDPYSGELVTEIVKEESLREFISAGGSIRVADHGVSLGNLFFEDNKISGDEMKPIAWP